MEILPDDDRLSTSDLTNLHEKWAVWLVEWLGR